MKSICKIAVLFIAFNTWTMISPQKATAQVSINFQAFYDDLSPYGSWVLNSHYGYVWIPDVAVGFIPYGTNGHWIYTNVGWTWVSNYPWGWAPFHYGRWYFDYIYGWIWVPDYDWGPAWVVWRRCEGYYGWAPIGPGISISFAYGGSYNLPSNQWILVRDRDMGRRNINNYYVRTPDNDRILRSSTVINNFRTDNSNKVRYGIGPNRDEIERRTGSKIKPIAIRERSKPGHNYGKNDLYIYKPRVERQTASGNKPIPYKVVQMKDVKPSNRSNASEQRNDRPDQRQPNNQNRDYDQSVPKSNRQNQAQYPQESNRGNQQAQNNNQAVPKPSRQNQEPNPGYQQRQRNEQSVPQQHNNKQFQPQYPQESNRGGQHPQRNEQSVPQPHNNRQYQPQYPQESNRGNQQYQRNVQPVPKPNQNREEHQKH